MDIYDRMDIINGAIVFGVLFFLAARASKEGKGMTIEDMQEAKEAMGLTYEDISKRSGLPLTTVQKVLGGFTKSPRYRTMQALERAFVPSASADQDRKSSSANGTYSYRSSYGNPGHRNQEDPGYPLPVLRDEGAVYHVNPDPSGFNRLDGGDTPERHYARQGSYTVQDRNALPGDVRTELINGVIYEMAAPKMIHQALQSEIAFQLQNYIRQKGGDCMCFVPDTDVIIDDSNKTVIMPDILVVCDRSKIHEDAVYGAPDLIIEILSPSTQKRDYTTKYQLYSAAGVREYWIIDPVKRKVIVYRLDLINEEPGVSGEPEQDGEKIAIYGFDTEVPVGIYGGDCKVDFRSIYEHLKFMYRD